MVYVIGGEEPSSEPRSEHGSSDPRIDDAQRLANVRCSADICCDSALAAVVAAAEAANAAWSQRRRQTDRLSLEYERAVEAEASARKRLDAIVDVVYGFAAPTAPPAMLQDGAGRNRRRLRWFRRAGRDNGDESPADKANRSLEWSAALNAQELRSTPPHDKGSIAASGPRQSGITGTAVEHIGLSLGEPAIMRARQPRSKSLGAGPLEPMGAAGRLDRATSYELRAHSDNASQTDMAIHFLGGFRLELGGRAFDVQAGAKSLRVLKYILANRDRPVPRDFLIELFWPQSSDETGRRNLHQAVYMLRRALRGGAPDMNHILFESDSYLMNPCLVIWADAEEFEQSAMAGISADKKGDLPGTVRALTRAEQCYLGDYLADSLYEDWALATRDRLRLLYIDVANRLADHLLESGDVVAALDLSRRLLTRETCDEEAYRRVMRCYSLAGQRNLVIQQYRTYVDCTARIYGLGPSVETKALYESLIADETVQ